MVEMVPSAVLPSSTVEERGRKDASLEGENGPEKMCQKMIIWGLFRDDSTKVLISW